MRTNAGKMTQPDNTRTPLQRRKAPASPTKKQPVLKPSQDDTANKKLVNYIMTQIVTDDISNHRKQLSEK